MLHLIALTETHTYTTHYNSSRRVIFPS